MEAMEMPCQKDDSKHYPRSQEIIPNTLVFAGEDLVAADMFCGEKSVSKGFSPPPSCAAVRFRML